MGNSKKKLIKMVDSMPAFPQSVLRLLQLTTDINCPPKEIVEIVEHDPVLTLHLLKLVNSPYFGLSRRISSIKQAVVFVGINTMKNLALSIAPMEALPKKKNHDPELNDLLLHAIATGAIARRLARLLGVPGVEAAEYYVAGLLHDSGKMALARCMPKAYRKTVKMAKRKGVPLHKMEKKTLGIDHNEMGAILGKKWHLPEDLVSCMRDHHSKDKKRPSQMRDCVFTANLIAKKLRLGHSGSPIIEENPPARILKRFGMDLPEIMKSLGDATEEIGRARLFLQYK